MDERMAKVLQLARQRLIEHPEEGLAKAIYWSAIPRRQTTGLEPHVPAVKALLEQQGVHLDVWDRAPEHTADEAIALIEGILAKFPPRNVLQGEEDW
jgi:hypothetical protein